MKNRFIALALTVGLFTGSLTNSFAQADTVQIGKEKQAALEENRKNVNLLNSEVQKNEQLQSEVLQSDTQKSANRLKDAQELAKTNKLIAKEASRVDKDASAAARESKLAVRAERKAQKQRIKANKLANDAAKATEKSNNN